RMPCPHSRQQQTLSHKTSRMDMRQHCLTAQSQITIPQEASTPVRTPLSAILAELIRLEICLTFQDLAARSIRTRVRCLAKDRSGQDYLIAPTTCQAVQAATVWKMGHRMPVTVQAQSRIQRAARARQVMTARRPLLTARLQRQMLTDR